MNCLVAWLTSICCIGFCAVLEVGLEDVSARPCQFEVPTREVLQAGPLMSRSEGHLVVEYQYWKCYVMVLR